MADLAPWLPVTLTGTAVGALEGAQQTSTNIASAAIANAQGFLNQLGSISDQMSSVSVGSAISFPAPTSQIDDFTTFTPPGDGSDIVANFPTDTTSLQDGSVNPLVVPGEIPFDVDLATFTDLAPPAAFSKSAPTPSQLPNRQIGTLPSQPASATIGGHTIPDVQNGTMPSPPTIQQLSLPTAPNIGSLEIDFARPNTDIGDIPNPELIWAEQDYASELLTSLKTRLNIWVNGMSTGLSDAVRSAIWDKHRDEVYASTEALITNSSRFWGAGGWDMPGGDLQQKVWEAEEKSTEQNSIASREIAIEEARLEQTNLHFAFTTALGLETILVQHSDQVAARALDAAKYIVGLAIDLYKLRLAKLEADVELYKADAEVLKARLQAQLAAIELYKAQIEGQQLLLGITEAEVKIYLGMLEGVRINYELYKARLEGTKLLIMQDELLLKQMSNEISLYETATNAQLKIFETQLKGDELLLKQFDSETEAFGNEIKLQGLSLEQYKTENDAQKTKAEISKIGVDAFSARVGANKVILDGRIAALESEITLNKKLPLEKWKIEGERLKIIGDNERSRIESLTEIYKAKGVVFVAQNDAEGKRIDSQVSVREQDIKYLIAKAESQVNLAKANAEIFVSKIGLFMEAAKVGGQVSAQIAAGAMSMVNISAGISASESSTNSTSNSVSVNISVDG